MKYTITTTIEVDRDAPFLEVGDTDNCQTILDLIKDMIYDQDYIKLDLIEVERED